MRIIILTHKEDRHFYFANQIIERTGRVVGVITGGKFTSPKPQPLTKKIADAKFWATVRNRGLSVLFRPSMLKLKREKSEAEQRAFSGQRERFEQRHQHLLIAEVDGAHGSINSAFYVDQIRAANPDVICIMGTCLVGKGIIASARLVINIHTGLSPYYRGGNTNLWPIIENDYGCFGVTVHTISLGIDSGDIIYTQRPDIFPDDTFGKVNTRCIQIGTDLMIRAIEHAARGTLRTIPQWTKGKLFMDRHFNALVARRYFQVKDRFFAEYCRRAAEDTLDRVRLIDNGSDAA